MSLHCQGQRSRFLQRALAELCCRSGLLRPWFTFPKSLFLPLFEGRGSSNAAAAAISFYAEGSGEELRWCRVRALSSSLEQGTQCPGQGPGHGCAPSTPALGSAVPIQDKPKPPRHPQIVRVCEKPRGIWLCCEGSRGTPGITDQVTVPKLSEFIPQER